MGNASFAASLSTEPDSDAALEQALARTAGTLEGGRADLVFAFVSHHHGPAIEGLGPEIARRTAAPTVIGCTGEGIVGEEREVESGPALAIWAAVLPDTAVRPFTVQAEPAGPSSIRFTGAPEVGDAHRAGVVLLADPFSFPISPYLEVLNDQLPGIPVIGGMASGGSGPGQNLLFTHEGVIEGGAVGVVVEGSVELCTVVSQGCRPVGKPFVITACRENVIRKLGGKPALQALVEMLPTLSTADRHLLQTRPFVGLAVDAKKQSFGREDFLVRGIVGIDQQQGALEVADDSLRVGNTVQFLVRDALSAGEDLTHLLRASVTGKDEEVAAAEPRPPEPSAVGALVFSCNGRGTRMFGTPDHDISCVRRALGAAVPAAGFFAMGEIGPVAGRNFIHGFTASVAVFRPRGPQ